MNSTGSQAAAILALVAERPEGPFSSELVASALICTANLIECGEHGRALEILDLLANHKNKSIEDGGELALRALRAWAFLRLERIPEASDSARAALEQSPTTAVSSNESWLMLRVVEAGCLWRTHQTAEAVRRLQSIRSELVLRTDCRVSCLCALELAAAYMLAGDRGGARAMVLEAWVSARRIGSSYFEAVASLNLAMLDKQCGRWSQATEEVNDALVLFTALGNIPFERQCYQQRAITEWKRGHLSAAQNTIGLVRDLYSSVTNEVDRWFASLLEAQVLIHLGRFSDATKTLNEEPDWQIPSKFSRRSLLTAEYLGDVDLEQGNAKAALARYEPALTQALALVPRGDIVAELRRRIAECHLLLGDAKLALSEANEALAHCREIHERYDEAATHRIIALAHAALGDHATARKAFEAGFAEYVEIETPYEWGKLWLSYGDWLAADSSATYRNLSAAREAFVAASDHFEVIGAEYRFAQARARLEALDAAMRAEGEAYTPTSAKVRPARRPRHSAELLRRSQWAFETFGLVTRSAPLLDMLTEMGRVSASDLPVLVLGESGTGKELIAKGVHLLSGRTGEFVAINCSAVPESMLEGEFFGYMKGSFTNAVADKPGLFEVAHDGTVFLDEIGEMSPDLQAKLLRFLETGTLRRVGATRDQQVDTRIVAATNRERAALQSGNGFRSDLYYRLAHAVYELPPLRARGDDLELLIGHFLDVYNRANQKSTRFSEPALARMLQHAWPGNVRELRAVIHKLVVAASAHAVFTPRELPLADSNPAANNFLGETVANEKKRILAALEQARFVKTEAANILRISRTTLLSKMKRMGIEG